MIIRNLNANLELEFTNEELNSSEVLDNTLNLFINKLVLDTRYISEKIDDSKVIKRLKIDISKDEFNKVNSDEKEEATNDDTEPTEEDRIREIERKYNPKLVREHMDYSRGDIVDMNNIKQHNDKVKVCSAFRCSDCGQATIMKVIKVVNGSTKENYVLRQVVDSKSVLINLDYEKTKELIEKLKKKFKYEHTSDEVKENKIIKAILKEFQKDNSYLIETDVVITYVDDKDHFIYLECPVCNEKMNIVDLNENNSEIDYMQCDYCGCEMFIDILNEDNYICSNDNCFSNMKEEKPKKNKRKINKEKL